jgi:hypothetical protein
MVERRYKVRLPKDPEEKHALEFTHNPKNWIDVEGVVKEYIYALYPPNSSIGIHAGNERKNSFCRLPMTNAETVKWGRAEEVASAITCKFCQARLVHVGLLNPKAPEVSAYARDYGTRKPPDYLYETGKLS